MLTRALSTEEAIVLINRTEGHFFDKKSAGISGAGLQKIVVALANADGGDILIGIEDDKVDPLPEKRWRGMASIEDFNGLLQALHDVAPQVPASMEFLVAKDLPGYVLSISVDKSAQVHQTSAKEVFLRKGAQSLPLKDAEKLIALKFAKGLASFEDTAVRNIPAEAIVDSAEMLRFLADYSPKTDALNFSVNENLIDLKTWDPKVCGLVLFAGNPSAMIPTRSGVRITRYETKEDDPERDHLASSDLYEGPAYQLIQVVVDAISKIMSSISIWTIDGLKKVSYPPEAIWEIVVNAIIHRDYSISDDVHIRIFDNRIEVQSPGRLPGFVTVDNILDVRYSRNKQIVRTLSRYKIAPNKDMGEGLNTAFQKMKEWKLKDPIIEEVENSVVVTIPHTPLAKPEELVIEFIKKNVRITNKQGRELTGIKSENAMKKVFYSLRDSGILEMIPKGNKTEWILVKDQNTIGEQQNTSDDGQAA
ncbi:ATP-binding protein [Burkholderia glumae]|uniref:ATP-binding protein n=1 Tax=Burkholderia glumae TaxID=337 RepID=UPI0003A48DAE|nr:ATP-binding protein [Burkholderia glumae]